MITTINKRIRKESLVSIKYFFIINRLQIDQPQKRKRKFDRCL